MGSPHARHALSPLLQFTLVLPRRLETLNTGLARGKASGGSVAPPEALPRPLPRPGPSQLWAEAVHTQPPLPTGPLAALLRPRACQPDP